MDENMTTKNKLLVEDARPETLQAIVALLTEQGYQVSAVAEDTTAHAEVSDFLDSIFQVSRDGLLSFRALRDEAGKIIDFDCTHANEIAAQMQQTPAEVLVGQSLLRQMPYFKELGLLDALINVVEQKQFLEQEVYLKEFNPPRWLQVNAVKYGDGLSMSVRDLTQRKELELQLAWQTTRDGLTQLANRRAVEEHFQREWKRCLRMQEPISVILADIDYFKFFNDSYGHLLGDECLIQVAKTLDKIAHRSTDLLGRFGGEEFILILPETPLPGAQKLAEEMARQVEALKIPHAMSSVSDYVTLSLGVASVIPGLEEADSEQLLVAADEALYTAKESGRNSICLAHP